MSCVYNNKASLLKLALDIKYFYIADPQALASLSAISL